MVAKQAADGTQTTTERIGGVNIMKKKFLLAIIPALMALSSCTYMQSATKAGMNANFLQEDTLAHEEIFDGSDLQLINPKQDDSNLPLRAPEDIVEPIIGVQYQEDTMEYDGQQRPVISFRYVAVIHSRHVKAEWVRAVSSQSGAEFKAKATKESTVAYSAISNGDDYITAESMGGTCFVVYTLYNIPLFEHIINGVANCNWSYIAAGLRLTDLDDNSKSTMSKVVCVEIGNRNHFSFHEEDLADDRGYFAAGIIEGSGTAANQRVVALPGDGDDNHAKEDFGLKKGDKFGVFKWSETSFKFLGSFNQRYETFYTKQSTALSSNYAEIAADGDYTLFVNNSDQYGFSASSMDVDIYLDTTDRWYTGVNKEVFVIYYRHGSTDNWSWIRMTTDVAGELYKYTLDVIAHPVFILLREPTSIGASGDGWPGCDNQTSNITFNSADSTSDGHASAFNNQFKITYWHDGTDDGTSNSSYWRFPHP